MVMLHDCIPCQHGHHERHIGVPGPVPEGLIGGWQCPCTGDCAERNRSRIGAEQMAISAVLPDDWPREA